LTVNEVDHHDRAMDDEDHHAHPHAGEDGTPWFEDVALPVLLGAGRSTYGGVIRRDLAAAGFDDMPRNGPRAVGGIRRNGNLRDVSKELGISKQAASQLVDLLVLRGYCDRVPDGQDRRRVTIGLTARGTAAAEVVEAAVHEVDRRLDEAAGAQQVRATRRVLAALVGMGDET
jgi:DNA-binding MarR family transcriptional regulator